MPTTMATEPSAVLQDATLSLEKYISYVSLLETDAEEESKLIAIQDLSSGLENISNHPEYPKFLCHTIRTFLKVLREEKPHFIRHHTIQARRILLLQIILRLLTNDQSTNYVEAILGSMYRLLEVENEENALVCLQIIIKLHQTSEPAFLPEITSFLSFVKTRYREWQKQLNKLFEPRPFLRIEDTIGANLDGILNETFTTTSIELVTAGETTVVSHLLPRSSLSLKVLAKLPVVLFLVHKLYKPNVHKEVTEFIHIAMEVIVLKPSDKLRNSHDFNREIFINFLSAQIRTISFIGGIIHVYQDVVNEHADQLKAGILNLLNLYPQELIRLRRELLVAILHIFHTDLTEKFVDSVEELCDTIFIPKGHAAYESLSALAYGVLTNFVQSVKQKLPFKGLVKAVTVFSKNMDDDGLLITVQIMSCRLLASLAEHIQNASNYNENGLEILVQMLKTFVLKFKKFAKFQLPVLVQKSHHQPCVAKAQGSEAADTQELQPTFGFPPLQAINYNIADCQKLVKNLVLGIKRITQGISTHEGRRNQNPGFCKQLQPKVTHTYVQLFKYSFRAMDVYKLSTPCQWILLSNFHSLKIVLTQMATQIVLNIMPSGISMEEKMVLEHLASVYSLLNPLIFREISLQTIDYLVERMLKNHAFQVVVAVFLAYPTMFPIFATILMDYLLKRMAGMGSNIALSTLYLQLFKLVFSSPLVSSIENEKVLKPYVHEIVNKSMTLSLTAKEPINYFRLLEALFKFIGNVGHDLLYHELLPLLPTVLRDLNALQNGIHKKDMMCVLLELSLSVPLRSSSLVPHLLPLIMEPISTVIKDFPALIHKGLHILEFCLDNLQPAFLFSHIETVKTELVQALWRTIHKQDDCLARVALRILGKLGGENRKTIMAPQKLEYCTNGNTGQCIAVQFLGYENGVSFPIGKVIETAFMMLKSDTTDAFYQKECWKIIKGFFASNIQQDTPSQGLRQLFSHPSFEPKEFNDIHSSLYMCSDAEARKIHMTALNAMFVAARITQLKEEALPFISNVVQHYTAAMVAQHYEIRHNIRKVMKYNVMDPLVLIDATAMAIGSEDMELAKMGSFALVLTIDTASILLSSKPKASQLSFYEYLTKKVCSLCYDRAWFAKLGGCIAINLFMHKIPRKLVYSYMCRFVKALLFVIMDMTGQLSYGVINVAKCVLNWLISNCGTPISPTSHNKQLIEIRKGAIDQLVRELIRNLIISNADLQEQVMQSLQYLAHIAERTVTGIIAVCKDILVDTIDQAYSFLQHESITLNIGVLTAVHLFIALPNSKNLFLIDLKQSNRERFFDKLLSIFDMEEFAHQQSPCYKSAIALKKIALKVLTALYYVKGKQNEIFSKIFRELKSPILEIQETAFNCMKKLLNSWKHERELQADRLTMVIRIGSMIEFHTNELNHIDSTATNYGFHHQIVDQTFSTLPQKNGQGLFKYYAHGFFRPVLVYVLNYDQLNIGILQQLNYLTQLFPGSFKPSLFNTLLEHLKKWTQVIPTIKNKEQAILMCSTVISSFSQATHQFIEPLLSVVLKLEEDLSIEAGSPFRGPLVKYFQHFPLQTMELFLSEQKMRDEKANRFLKYLLKDEKGKPFRKILQKSPLKDKLCMYTMATLPNMAICIISLIVKYDDQWLSGQSGLINRLLSIWISREFQEHLHEKKVNVTQWIEPKLLAKCLLNFVKHNKDEIELLFQLLRAFTGRHNSDFEFFRDFLENTIAKEYDVGWKRNAFFTFIKIWPDHSFPRDLKAKILEYILIPSFTIAFDKGEGLALIEGRTLASPSQVQYGTENVINVFIDSIIDLEEPFKIPNAVPLFQFSCLLVERGSRYICNAEDRKQAIKLKSLISFARPFLLTKNWMDPCTKYYGHLLLAHIIVKFPIQIDIVTSVFRSLLKAHVDEAQTVVKQALDILTTVMAVRTDNGNNMLAYCTKKIIVEEGYALRQLVHLTELLVRHQEVYYPVRNDLIHYIVNSMQSLTFSPCATLEHKKLAVDLVKITVQWELQYCGEINGLLTDKHEVAGFHKIASIATEQTVTTVKMQGSKREKMLTGMLCELEPDKCKPIDKIHADNIVDLLLRMVCQVNRASTVAGSAIELLSERCFTLLEVGLQALWPNENLNLIYFEKLLQTVEAKSQQPNLGNMCRALDFLSFLLKMRKEAVLPTLHSLQTGISTCLKCNDTKVVRSVQKLLPHLMSLFPIKRTKDGVASTLEALCAAVYNTLCEGFQTYEKSTENQPSTLFGTLMILGTACENNPCYIDQLVYPFMKSLEKMTEKHLDAVTHNTNSMNTVLLISSLNLVKDRVGVMDLCIRKTFIQTILFKLIKKTPKVKVLKTIIKMLEEWMKLKRPINQNPSPPLQELVTVLLTMAEVIEQRFPNESELNAQYFELIFSIHIDATLIGTDFYKKLEPTFVAGLRSNHPQTRTKFFRVLNASMPSHLHECLLYIEYFDSWGTMGPYFWIKQCIELLFDTVADNLTIQSSTPKYQLPSITSILNLEGSINMTNDAAPSSGKVLPRNGNKNKKAPVKLSKEGHRRTKSVITSRIKQLTNERLFADIVSSQKKFFESLQEIKTIDFLSATAQLCHMDTSLSQYLWMEIFPRLWKIFPKSHQDVLAEEWMPLLSNVNRVMQKSCRPSAIGTFAESVAQLIPIEPTLLKHLGVSHNIWHRSCLLLENLLFSTKVNTKKSWDLLHSPSDTNQRKTLDVICDLYSQLREEDLWSAIWQKYNKFGETSLGVMFEQHGFFETAQSAYENGMLKCKREWTTKKLAIEDKFKFYHNHWIRCSKELNDWEAVLTNRISNEDFDPCLVLNNSCRNYDDSLMVETLEMGGSNPSEKMPIWKVNLYKGYFYICQAQDPCINAIKQLLEVSSDMCIRQWRCLPHIVSSVHLPILQAAQQFSDLLEAAEIRQGLLSSNIEHQDTLDNIKKVVATWKGRVPIVSDDLSYWSKLLAWHSKHYEAIIFNFDQRLSAPKGLCEVNLTNLGYCALSKQLIQFSKNARKCGLASVSLNALKNLPGDDDFQKLKEELKCYLQLAADNIKSNVQKSYSALCTGLKLMDATCLDCFSNEMLAEFNVIKGIYLSQLGIGNPNQHFRTAIQTHDGVVKAWAAWGDYLEEIFMRNEAEGPSIEFALEALVCFLNYCQHQSETKSRKYIAKVLWLMAYDNSNMQLINIVNRYSVSIPPSYWVPWLPQLLTLFIQNEGQKLLDVLKRVGETFPQAFLLPIRTLCLTLQMEEKEKTATGQSAVSSNSEAAWRCSHIMHRLRNSSPTVYFSLVCILDQMTRLHENVYEDILRQLRHGLAECYSFASENIEAILDINISPKVLNFVKNIISTSNIESEKSSSLHQSFAATIFGLSAGEVQVTKQDYWFQKMKEIFTADFNFETIKFRDFTNKLMKWVKALEAQCKLLPKSFLIEEKSRYLSLFTQHIADIELPGEFILPISSQEHVRIAQFMPQVDIVHKRNAAARRLYIKGHNGKIYPYLILAADISNTRQESRILQLLRMLNYCLQKQRETARRYLRFTVPKVVSLTPKMDLVEDNLSSVSFFDIYKDCCEELKVEHENPLHRFYDKLATIQACGLEFIPKLLCDILEDIQKTFIPRNSFKKWAERTYSSATDYWTFRKQFTLQLSLIGFIEHSLHLTCIHPNMMYIHQESGLITVSDLKFSANDKTGVLDCNRPVPFRLTPNITEFITPAGIYGPMSASMIAAARCFLQPSYKISTILKVILRDEMIDWFKRKHQTSQPNFLRKDIENNFIVQTVTVSVSAITERIQSLAEVGNDNKASQLLTSACNPENFCRMDPAWHPWF